MSDPDPERQTEGYFEVRRSARHPWTAAHVRLDGDVYVLTLRGVELAERWPRQDVLTLFAQCLLEERNAFTHPLLSVWLFGRPCDKTAYDYRLKLGRWAAEHAPTHPAARPDDPVDINAVPIRFLI